MNGAPTGQAECGGLGFWLSGSDSPLAEAQRVGFLGDTSVCSELFMVVASQIRFRENL